MESGKGGVCLLPQLIEKLPAEHLSASASQTDFVIERLSSGTGPVVDLASGAGALVEEIARRLTRPVVATDFSPSILRRDRIRVLSSGQV